MKKQRSKLPLRKETITKLTRESLASARGGAKNDSSAKCVNGQQLPNGSDYT